MLMAIVAGSANLIASARLSNARSLTSRSPVPKIDGLVAWYETSRKESFKTSEAVDGEQVTAWYDVSPGSITKQRNTLTRAASAAVTYQASGIGKLPSVYFDGTNRIQLASFYQGVTSQNTIFIVANPSVAYSVMLDSSSGAGPSTISQNPDSIGINLGSMVGTGTVTNPVVNLTNSSYVVAVYFNGSSSKAYFNNALTMAGGATINPGTAVLTGLSIGANHVNTTCFTGLISEIIIYNRPLETQERKDVMNYLSQKYGITVTGI